jgi:hypothetical protein
MNKTPQEKIKTMIYWNDNIYESTIEIAEAMLQDKLWEESVEFFRSKPDDWFIEADECRLEPIYDFNAKDMVRIVDEDRFSEDNYDRECSEIAKAFEESVDFEKLNSSVPMLWYPYKKIKLTKEDFLVNLI